jgi:hypothetical protein
MYVCSSGMDTWVTSETGGAETSNSMAIDQRIHMYQRGVTTKFIHSCSSLYLEQGTRWSEPTVLVRSRLLPPSDPTGGLLRVTASGRLASEVLHQDVAACEEWAGAPVMSTPHVISQSGYTTAGRRQCTEMPTARGSTHKRYGDFSGLVGRYNDPGYW